MIKCWLRCYELHHKEHDARATFSPRGVFEVLQERGHRANWVSQLDERHKIKNVTFWYVPVAGEPCLPGPNVHLTGTQPPMLRSRWSGLSGQWSKSAFGQANAGNHRRDLGVVSRSPTGAGAATATIYLCQKMWALLRKTGAFRQPRSEMQIQRVTSEPRTGPASHY